MTNKKDTLKLKALGIEASAQGLGGFVTLLLLAAMAMAAKGLGWL